MRACDLRSMRDEIETPSIEETQNLDPYGDVALGVECAWPERLPALYAFEAEVKP
jgi:hypothetical protein